MSVFSINIHGVYIVDFTVLGGLGMAVSMFILPGRDIFCIETTLSTENIKVHSDHNMLIVLFMSRFCLLLSIWTLHAGRIGM